MNYETIDYGLYHKKTIIISLSIGILSLSILVLSSLIIEFLRVFFIILGFLGIILFLWPSLGLITVNLLAGNNKTHPTTNLQEICELNSPMILDIGCGTGRCSIKLAKSLKKDGHIYGIDIFNSVISGNSIQRVQANARIENVEVNTTFKFGSIFKIPFQDDFFDVVNIAYVLHEINDKKKALSEIYRVLKPDGWLFITEFHKRSLLTFLLNGIYTLLYKNHRYWIELLEENHFIDIIYVKKGPIAVISCLKK
jgi:ubiquinone/menaquinone biosynthesis C-methylase UbiE